MYNENMKVINNTKNTVWVEDVDFYLKYLNGEISDIDTDLLKRSRQLRSYIVKCPDIDIVEIDEEQQIEVSMRYLKEKQKSSTPKKDKPKQPKPSKKASNKVDDPKPVSVKKPEPKPEPEKPPKIADLQKVLSDVEVKLHGMFYDAGGYSKVNRNLALKLKESGCKVHVSAKKSTNHLNAEELKPIVELERTRLTRNHISIDSIIPSFSEMSGGRHKVLYTTVESYSVPDQFLQCCGSYNEVWVTSDWSKSILSKYIDRPVHSMPTGVDHELYTEHGPKFDFRPNIKGFVFISVFGWSYRKGYDVLLKSYLDEFSGNDDVSLLIVSRYQTGVSQFHKNKIRDDINKIIAQFPSTKNLPHITRYGHIVPEKDMPMLYRASDCFILTSRGEGGCLPPLEASLCGLPVIMTNCSGQQQYLRQDNSYMIDIDAITEIQPGQMHLHYWDGQKFPALVSPEVIRQTRAHMRYVYENRDEAKKKNKNLQRLILENYTWNNNANRVIDRLKTIVG